MMRSIKNATYFIWDLITLRRGVEREISGFRVRFPPKWSKYHEPDYEIENVKFIRAHCGKNMKCVDIGAHLGLFSVIAGKLVGAEGRVYSFEPTPVTFQALCRIIAINHLTGTVTPVHAAVSDIVTKADFHIDSHEGSNANSLVVRTDKARTPVRVNVVTLDSYVKENQIPRIDFIKIDAEGTELSVLRGAAQVIERDKPKIILAIHPILIRRNNHRPEEIFPLLKEWGYEVWLEGSRIEREEFCAREDFFDVHLIPFGHE
ncbi:MAG: FkbM family methyltransferase [Cytophagales bacterium]|nr:FkbM family methyltransferase [Cytophagales bacterium]